MTIAIRATPATLLQNRSSLRRRGSIIRLTPVQSYKGCGGWSGSYSGRPWGGVNVNMGSTSDIKEVIDQIKNVVGEVDQAVDASVKLPVDVLKEKSQFILKADIPGLVATDVSLKVEDKKLLITAERKVDLEVTEDSKKIKSERSFGKLSRSLNLAKDCDIENITANVADGVLTVVVPRKPNENVINVEVTGPSPA